MPVTFCGAERLRRRGRRRRRSRCRPESPRTTLLKPAFVDVVAEAQDEGGVDCRRCCRCAGRFSIAESLVLRWGGRIEVDDQEVFGEVFGLGDELAGGAEDGGVAVEDEVVVSSNLVDVDDGYVPALCLEAEEFVAVFVFSQDEGGGGDVEEDFGAGVGEGFDGVEVVEGMLEEFFIVPEVFANGNACGVGIEEGDFGIGAGAARLEVAGFIENVVGGGRRLLKRWARIWPSRRTATALWSGRPALAVFFSTVADEGGDALAAAWAISSTASRHRAMTAGLSRRSLGG